MKRISALESYLVMWIFQLSFMMPRSSPLIQSVDLRAGQGENLCSPIQPIEILFGHILLSIEQGTIVFPVDQLVLITLWSLETLRVNTVG